MATAYTREMAYSAVPKAFQGDQPRQSFIDFGDTYSSEKPKPAINTTLSWKEMAVHLLGLAMTAIVIVIHALNVYWVDLGDDGKLSINASLKYLQFAAKLHEVVMMASLSSVILFFLHKRLLKRGIPFGYLDASYMIGAGGGTGLLLTKRSWSPWRHKRLFFGLLVCILYTLALAPSSAIAMIPTLRHWPVKDPYDTGEGRMPHPWPMAEPQNGWPFRSSPECFNESALSEPDCPAGGLGQIIQWAEGNIMVGSSSNLTVHEMTNFERLLVSHSLKSNAGELHRNASRRVTTTPKSSSVDAIGGFWAYLRNRDVGKISKPELLTPMLKSTVNSAVYQPLVYSQCRSHIYSDSSSGLLDISHDRFQTPWEDNPSDLPSPRARFRWIKASTLSTTSFTILPMITHDATGQERQSSLIVSCLFDARWAASIVSLKPRSSSLIESNITDLNIFEDESIAEKRGPKSAFKRALNISELVELPENWLRGFDFDVTDQIEDEEQKISMMAFMFDGLASYTNQSNRHFGLTDSDAPKGSNSLSEYSERVTDFVGTFQSMLIADGMARFGSRLWRPYVEVKRDGKLEYVNLMGSNYISTASPPENVFYNGTKEDSFSIEFAALRYGYGYGFRSEDTSRSIYVAVSVLGIYLLITICYGLCICLARFFKFYTRSQSWEAIPNLIALAENSQLSNYLSGTSAGIDSRETWRLNVKVRVMEDEKLSLVFMKPGEDYGEQPRPDIQYY
ncbi:hypothetical protein BKA66DRAFT_547692 [Pyrenochaeta sp. MPI-SDFR-AT-0127]|nr:hypothetical protein BKA66DRAFT_547692 [Pyrenochaeta sp. MPI-SDFR-AT-0127]